MLPVRSDVPGDFPNRCRLENGYPEGLLQVGPYFRTAGVLLVRLYCRPYQPLGPFPRVAMFN